VAHNNHMTKSLALAQVHKGLEIKNSCDDIILILIVGYVCDITITGGSSQHSAVALFGLYVAASERSHLDAVWIRALQMGNLTVFKSSFGIVCNTHSTNLGITFVIAGNFYEIVKAG